jgi:hypothetical protein
MRALRPLVLGITIVVTMSTVAAAGTPTEERVTGRRFEAQGTGNAGFFAWSKDEAGDPNASHVWVKPAGSRAFEVSQRGHAFAGQVDQSGSLLAYWFYTNADADVRLYDMASKTRVAVPTGVNTSKDEYFSAVFGNQMIFVRSARNTTRLFLVTDRTTGDKVAIRTLDNRHAFVANQPHLYGNWVTYSICNARFTACSAYRYDIAGTLQVTVPNPNQKYYFAPSADLAGNVYFEQSGAGCGLLARLMTWTGTCDPVSF